MVKILLVHEILARTLLRVLILILLKVSSLDIWDIVMLVRSIKGVTVI